jgi:AraC family transcriptional regulator
MHEAPKTTSPNAPAGEKTLLRVRHIAGAAHFADPQLSECVLVILPGEHAALCVGCGEANGRDRTSTLRAHQVAVIPAGRKYSLYSARPGEDRTAADALLLELDEAFFLETARGTCGEQPRLVERLATADPFLREIGNNLRKSAQPPEGAYLDSLAAVIAVHLARNYCEDTTRAPVTGGLPLSKLQRVQAYIEAHIGESLHVDRIAASVHMSPFHFARLFKKATGHSPHVYLTLRRVEHAKQLLRTTELPLLEVGSRCGFQTQGHFTGVFHRYAGVTPRVYRVSSHETAPATAAAATAATATTQPLEQRV